MNHSSSPNPPSNGNGKFHETRTERAKWTIPRSGAIPPLGFVIPDSEVDWQALAAAPEGNEREAWVRRFAESALLGRYGTSVEKLRAATVSSDSELSRVEADLVEFKDARAKTLVLAVQTLPTVTVPKNGLGAAVIFLVFVAALLGLSEWFNAAWPARNELQSLAAAFSCTAIFAVTGLALKLATGRVRIVIATVAFAFLCLYSARYAADGAGDSANAIVDQLLNSSERSTHSTAWIKPFLLIFQMVASTVIGYVLAHTIGKLTVTPPRMGPNPDRVALNEELARLEAVARVRRQARGESTGDLVEFENCVLVHVFKFLGVLATFQRLAQAKSALQSSLTREITELESKVSGRFPQLNNHRNNTSNI